jgi:hypothetical protein
MSWHWGVFLIAWIVCTVLVIGARRAMIPVNVLKYGPRAADVDSPAFIAGSAIAGGSYALIITAIVGLIY